MGTLQSSLESNRRTMIKIAIAVCLAALAAAEADADAFYGPYDYGHNWPMYSGNRWNMRHGYNYGKRSADAEPEADADAYYHPYMNWPMNSGFNMNYMNNWNMNNNWNMWNRYGMQQRYNSYSFGKRSADAEPKADAWYGPYGYSMNNMNNMIAMSYMNRPYNFYGYRYHF